MSLKVSFLCLPIGLRAVVEKRLAKMRQKVAIERERERERAGAKIPFFSRVCASRSLRSEVPLGRNF